MDYRDSKIHHNTSKNEISEIEGVLCLSEGSDKFVKPVESNDDLIHNHIRIDC